MRKAPASFASLLKNTLAQFVALPYSWIVASRRLMPRRLLEVSAVYLCGRPIRFIITCLIAIGLSGGETCLCGSSLAAGSGSSHCAKAAPKVCCCGKPGPCRCRSACCQKSAPDKSVPLQQNKTNDSSGVAKVLSHYLVAFAPGDASAAWFSGKSPYALASLLSPATLQLQHVRMQV